jgi:hypothetical protein
MALVLGLLVGAMAFRVALVSQYITAGSAREHVRVGQLRCYLQGTTNATRHGEEGLLNVEATLRCPALEPLFFCSIRLESLYCAAILR